MIRLCNLCKQLKYRPCHEPVASVNLGPRLGGDGNLWKYH